jgi:hypothetical protein
MPKISELTAVATPARTQYTAVVDSTTTKRMTVAQILGLAEAGDIDGLTEAIETVIAAADITTAAELATALAAYTTTAGLGDLATLDTITASLVTDFNTAADARITAAGLATDAEVAAGYQPLNAKLTALAALANASGQLTNNGSGVLTWEAAAGGVTDLEGLSDVDLTSPTTGDFLWYNGSIWINSPLEAADVTDFAAAADARIALADLSDLATRSASDLSSGTLPDGRFPATLPAISGANLTNLDAGDLASGTIPDARFPATLPALNGSALTALNASNLGSGTVPDARFPATLPAASGANLTALNGTNISTGTVAAARIADLSATYLTPAAAAAAYQPIESVATVAVFRDTFAGQNTTSNQIGDLGWAASNGSTVAPSAPDTGYPGGISRSTTSTISTVATTTLHALPGLFLGSETFDCIIVVKLDQTDSDTTARFGLAGNNISNPPTRGIYFEKLAADTNWFRVTRNASTETRTDTGVAASTSYLKLRIRRVDGSNVGFTVNAGSEVNQSANVPTTSLFPFLQIVNAAAVAKLFTINYFELRLTGLTR